MLDKLNFKTPTPIQAKSIPLAIEGKDLLGLAQTGTGKTLAFSVPMVQAVLQGKHGLIILPTRELAIQVQEVLHKIGTPLGINTALLVGGESINRQLTQLRRNPAIVVGTPGRIIDHLQQKTLSLRNVNILVLTKRTACSTWALRRSLSGFCKKCRWRTCRLARRRHAESPDDAVLGHDAGLDHRPCEVVHEAAAAH